MSALEAESKPADLAMARCPQQPGRVVCVDQDHQTLWVQQGSEIIFPAVPIRTGLAGFRTPDGSYRISWRKEWLRSNLFDEAMPYSFFFFRGYALHGTYDDVHKGTSHGCVNLTLADAKRLWNLLDLGDLVHIWGHR